jgi:hypothetical protein
LFDRFAPAATTGGADGEPMLVAGRIETTTIKEAVQRTCSTDAPPPGMTSDQIDAIA